MRRKTECLISAELFQQFGDFIAARMGLHFPKERRNSLERATCSIAREFGFEDTNAFILWLLSSHLEKEQLEVMASHLTVGESYFFRDKKIFNVLKKHILPELVSSRQNTEKFLRFWSAGCCTGEEAYSIAIVLSEIVPDIQDWNATILATDINTHFIEVAQAGVYREWSFRGSPKWLKKRYFTKTEAGSYRIDPRIREMVTFSYHNLAEDIYPSLFNNTNAMDVIFCSNVIMYFTPECAALVIENLYNSLADGGFMIVSPCELSQSQFKRFRTVNLSGSTLYRKCTDNGLPAETPPADMMHRTKTFLQPPAALYAKPAHETAPPFEQAESPAAGMDTIATDAYTEAAALNSQGLYAEAERKIHEWLSLKQDDAKAMSLLARIHANRGNLRESHDWCQKAIDSEKLHPGHYCLLATILQEQGDIDRAVQSLRRALYINPDFVIAIFTLGNLLKQQGKLMESERYFENAVSLLGGYGQSDILPESEGMTAGRMMEIIQSTAGKEAPA
jgi:chemotaxis protein methyltransferase CheR